MQAQVFLSGCSVVELIHCYWGQFLVFSLKLMFPSVNECMSQTLPGY